MESQSQNPEFRNNPENFHSNMDYRLYNIKVSMIFGNIYTSMIQTYPAQNLIFLL